MCISSCMVSVGYVFLVLACLACALSYASPFWILPSSTALSLKSLFMTNFIDLSSWGLWSAGLWGACSKSGDEISCRWFWQDDFYIEKKLPDWFKAAQGLFAAGVILLFIAFLLCTFHICCRCCKESFSIGSVIGSFIVTGTICSAVGIGLFGGYMAKEYNVGFENNQTTFYWAFFVGIAGAAMAAVSAILFYLDRCCSRTHTGYHMTRVV